ncbi:hypothetical protein [Thermomonas sp. LB-4]|uniref:hypothetical protein n=1 Tax=Thermomonas sp. LB-4 TaxID=3102790 RepID=UPI002EDB6076
MRTELQMLMRARMGKPQNGPNYLDAASQALLRSIEAASHLEDWVKHEFYYHPQLLLNPDLVAAVKNPRVPMRTWNTLKREEQRRKARLYGDPIDYSCWLFAADWYLRKLPRQADISKVEPSAA